MAVRDILQIDCDLKAKGVYCIINATIATTEGLVEIENGKKKVLWQYSQLLLLRK